MAQAVSIDTNIAKDIVATLKELKREVALLRERLEAEPSYGSRAWWEWSDKKAIEEIKAGKGTKITNKKELDAFFKSL